MKMVIHPHQDDSLLHDNLRAALAQAHLPCTLASHGGSEDENGSLLEGQVVMEFLRR